MRTDRQTITAIIAAPTALAMLTASAVVTGSAICLSAAFLLMGAAVLAALDAMRQAFRRRSRDGVRQPIDGPVAASS